MREKSKMFRDRIGPLGVIKNVKYAVKKDHAESRHNAPAEKSRSSRAALAHLRDGDGRGQDEAIKNVHVIRGQRAPQTKIGDVLQIADEVVKGVSKPRGREGGHPDAQSLVLLEEIQKNWIKKDIDHQFFEIKIIAVPELRDGSRRQRPVRISQSVETGHAAASDEAMAPNRDGDDFFEKLGQQAGPAHIPGIGSALH